MPRHLAARIAWHDSGWDGRICSNPSSNPYCVGTHSLLSDRLRRDRNVTREDAVKSQKADVLGPDYIPPCYWGINAFGSQTQAIRHRHPFAGLNETHTVDEELPPHSVFTWPFRISFNFEEETRRRYGSYHRDFEQRINDFFAAHREGQSLVFLYLNYDNPVSGETSHYALVGCGLLKEKGRPTRFAFEPDTLDSFKSRPGMQNFPVANWSRRLSLDPETVVRLPYQEYVRHVRKSPEDESKLNDISVLIDDPALLPSFKYVCDSMDDDQCLVLLYRLRRAFDRVAAHGIASATADESLRRIDGLIQHVWTARGAYPGAAGVIALLAKFGGNDKVKEEHARQLVESLRESVGPEADLADKLDELLRSNAPVAGNLQRFRNLISDAREGVQADPAALARALDLSGFSLTGFQMERLFGSDSDAREFPPLKETLKNR